MAYNRASGLLALALALTALALVDRASRDWRVASPSAAASVRGTRVARVATCHAMGVGRRAMATGLAAGAAGILAGNRRSLAEDAAANTNLESMEALKGKGYGKSRMKFSDYVQSPTGLQYTDLRVGKGQSAADGDECVVDWSGYTIGYYGRPFEARDKAKGGDFTGDEKELFRFTLGDGKVIPGFEEAVRGMKEGGIRRFIVPVELGYPDNDMKKKGPKPTTFSGKRALGFVLENQGMIDKTLLFDVELIKIKPAK
mmetsp:Transcript_19993/g.38744  ORF Transcript_19993/g.38744 Transcript_19993/m.38744 type:complete len:257 (-) Transcript_19993:207-977(-)|eukprot:CAMPEP_0167782344 /NCGR_PEP_ID=MMETSP0111_2-20121227/6465_1 /TAXON_ID=91324 /ORGANISM="Lotharella globosa, Strain CCCM811" /LENGTH=256 /DNA_ID=CAMNT_0007673165 /DNA_START=9 /DNA_END=779 /DNA_ORIENTATION=-